jgi:hypothetical protein
MMLERISLQPIFSFADVGRSEWPESVAALRWPCRYDAYDVLGQDFYRIVTDLPAIYSQTANKRDTFGDAQENAAAMWLALAMALPTLAQAARCAIEDGEARRTGGIWCGSPGEMPLLSWLMAASNEPPQFLTDRWQRSVPGGLKAHGKRFIKNAISTLRLELPFERSKPRLVTAAPLFNQFHTKSDPNNGKPIDVGYAFTGLDNFAAEKELRDDIDAVAAAWTDAVVKLCPAIAGAFGKRLSDMAQYVFSVTISTAWRDMRHIMTKMPRRRLGEGLWSGTPTHAGRVLGWWYRQNGLPVYRFAHGGDRGTHLDPGWDVIELPFCSHYHTHGRLEKENLEARATAGEICRNFLERPTFVSSGSLKHQQIYLAAQNKQVDRGNKTGRSLLYVPGAYASEIVPLSPIFKTPDHLYVEWQLWLIRELTGRGYEVTVKLHPGGQVAGATVFKHTGCKLIGGYFDSSQLDYDCLLFDFPGSAWFDALASDAAIVLIELGPRPLDPRSASLIKRRCPGVRYFQDENNRLRADMEALNREIEQAQKQPGCENDLARRLFWK